MTQAGMIMGTAGYMSPEQVTGTPADARSDIFSLGIIIYEMLAGKPAFEASTTVETMTAILRSDAPELPAGIEMYCSRWWIIAWKREPARRYQSAKDLAFSLNAYAGRQSSVAARAATTAAVLRKPRRILRFVTVGLGVLVAAAIAALFLRKPGADLQAYQSRCSPQRRNSREIQHGRLTARMSRISGLSITRRTLFWCAPSIHLFPIQLPK